jgi:hypothetical protein
LPPLPFRSVRSDAFFHYLFFSLVRLILLRMLVWALKTFVGPDGPEVYEDEDVKIAEVVELD